MAHYPLQNGEKVVQCVAACDEQMGGYSVNGAILFCTLCSARKMKYPSQIQETDGKYQLQQCTPTCKGKSAFNSYKVNDYAHGEEGYCVSCDFAGGSSLESLPNDSKDTKCIVCQGSVIHNTSTGAYYCKDCPIYQIATPNYPAMPKIDGNDFECVDSCEFSLFTELSTQRKYCMDCTNRYLFQGVTCVLECPESYAISLNRSACIYVGEGNTCGVYTQPIDVGKSGQVCQCLDTFEFSQELERCDCGSMVLGLSGKCEEACGAYQQLNPVLNECSCAINREYNGSDCVCVTGFHVGLDGDVCTN